MVSDKASIVPLYGVPSEIRDGLVKGPGLNYIRGMRTLGGRIYLLDILNRMRRYECQDPRDKVYAALGMAVDVRDNDIVPDYSKSPMEVYMDVVKFSVANANEDIFNFLGYVTRFTSDMSDY